jgi:hypothetical protein
MTRGELDGYAITGEIIDFNVISNTWETAPPMEEERAHHGMAAVPYSAVQRFCWDHWGLPSP